MKLRDGVDQACNVNLLGYGTLRALAERLSLQGKTGDFVTEASRRYALDGLPTDRDGTEKLLRRLGTQGATVKDLIYYLYKIKFGDGLDLFVEPESPAVVTQPDARVTVVEGHPLSLCCVASGIPSPIYEWRKGTDAVPGQNKSTMTIERARLSDNGVYFCRAKNASGEAQSVPVTVVVQAVATHTPLINQLPAVRQSATNKVALLVGNCNYRCDKPLTAPAHDVYMVGKKLTEMKFKVITCKNLRKNDMLCIVDFFVELLTEGVYGLLYFAGHGFENHGQCYLVPSDAPTDYSSDSCVSAEYVLAKMQNKLPALCVVMLDICREMKHSEEMPPPLTYVPKPNGNCVVAYATSFGRRAWEKPQISIFAKHLLKFIDKPLPILSMLQEVVTSVGKDEQAKELQFPEIRSNLRDYGRLLSDDICSVGCTMEVSRSAELWQKVAELPNARFYEKHYPELGIKVVFHLAALYSNIIVINIGCIKTDSSHVRNCQAYISWVKPFTVKASARQLKDPGKWPAAMKQHSQCLTVTENTIADLQLLDEDLLVHVTIEAYYDTSQGTQVELLPCNFGRPLIAQLRIASVIQDPTAANPCYVLTQSRRAPVECADVMPVESVED